MLAALVVAREVVLNDASSAAEPDPGPSRPPTPSAPVRTAPEERVGRRYEPRPKGSDSLGRLSGRLQKMPGPKTPTRPLDERQAKLEAERAFRSGMVLLLQNMMPGAHREFARAAELEPSEPEYRMYEAWVSYLTARGEEQQTLARAKAQACASRVLQDRKDSNRAHSILGQLAHSRGELDAAERHFRMALRYDPNDRDAQRGLRLLEQRKT